MNKTLFFAILVFILSVGQSLGAPVPWPVKPAKTFFRADGGIKEISTPEEFALMVERLKTNPDESQYYILKTDIVINEGDAKTWAKNPPKYEWIPAGLPADTPYVNFDGNGHTISGIYINTEDSCQGLFGAIRGYVYNLNIVNSYIKGGNNVGALAGSVWAPVNVYVDAIVEGNDNVGGIIGKSSQMVSNGLVFKGSVKGKNHVGGIVGAVNSGELRNSDNYGSVYGERNVGGIYGGLDKTEMKAINLKNYGTIVGKVNVGGIAGVNSFNEKPENKDAYPIRAGFLRNMGEVIGEDTVAGIFAKYSRPRNVYYIPMKYSYNAGRVRGVSSVQPLYEALYKDSASCYKCVNFKEVYENGGLVAEKIRESQIDLYVDSLGPSFIPDSGKVKINDGFPILLTENKNFKYLAGKGTKESPFLISSLDDLIKFKKHSQAYTLQESPYYRQTEDIEWDASMNWIPDTLFEIDYDGGNHKISNLYSHNENGCGAFIDSVGTAVFKNLFLENADVMGAVYAAGLICHVSNVEVSNLKVSGSVTAAYHYRETLSWMSRAATAGVVATAIYATIRNTVNMADVSASENAGGIFGMQPRLGTVNLYNVVNKGNITGHFYAGGISAQDGNILYAENYGDVSGSSYVGGISGHPASVSKSFNRGKITGYDYVGGIAGKADILHDVYNAGSIDNLGNPLKVGAIVGQGLRYYGKQNGIWSSNVAGVYYQKDGLALAGHMPDSVNVVDSASFTATEFKDKATADKMGRTFRADEDNVNDGYPILAFDFKGNGSEASPFLVETKEDLMRLSELLLDTLMRIVYANSHYKLTSDIKFDSTDKWIPLGYSDKLSFRGVFDGGNHTVSGIRRSDSTYAGFFNYLYGATVKNLGIKDSRFRADDAAAIAANAVSATISNCWNDNSYVYAYKRGGGILGYVWTGARIDRVYNTGTIEGSSNIAGIVGYLNLYQTTDSYLVNAYHRGTVKSSSNSSIYGIAYINGSAMGGSNILVKNLYTTDTTRYMISCSAESCDFNSMFHIKRNDEDSTGMTAEEMKTKEFAERLGDAFAFDEKGVNGGFPIFSGKESVIPGANKDSAEVVIPVQQKKVPSAFAATAGDKNILLQGNLQGKKIAVFDVKGSKVWMGTATANTHSIPVSRAGVYLVRCGKQTVKIAVR